MGMIFVLITEYSIFGPLGPLGPGPFCNFKPWSSGEQASGGKRFSKNALFRYRNLKTAQKVHFFYIKALEFGPNCLGAKGFQKTHFLSIKTLKVLKKLIFSV